MKLPVGARIIIERLANNGYRGDIVGGCVRDNLLGKEPNDYDITTNAVPDEMVKLFSDMRTVETGLKHGTLTVMHGGEPYEVTTYRLDGEYTDNRHPDSVTFTDDLALDLSRRDFTVNAMCYSPEHGLTDLFGGREDIEAGVIRAVGDPERRFTEDALRILRALRFAATLDFKIDGDTSLALRSTAHLMKRVSSERIMTEWTKLLTGVGAYRIITEYFDVLSGVIPNITLSGVPSESAFLSESRTVRELSLFSCVSDFDFAMRSLKSDSKRRRHGALVLEYEALPTSRPEELNLLLVKAGLEATENIIALRRLRGLGDGENILSDLIRSGACYEISHLALKGDDLRDAGLQGREIGYMLSEMLTAVALGTLKNTREELLEFIKHC